MKYEEFFNMYEKKPKVSVSKIVKDYLVNNKHIDYSDNRIKDIQNRVINWAKNPNNKNKRLNYTGMAEQLWNELYANKNVSEQQSNSDNTKVDTKTQIQNTQNAQTIDKLSDEEKNKIKTEFDNFTENNGINWKLNTFSVYKSSNNEIIVNVDVIKEDKSLEGSSWIYDGKGNFTKVDKGGKIGQSENERLKDPRLDIKMTKAVKEKLDKKAEKTISKSQFNKLSISFTDYQRGTLITESSIVNFKIREKESTDKTDIIKTVIFGDVSGLKNYIENGILKNTENNSNSEEYKIEITNNLIELFSKLKTSLNVIDNNNGFVISAVLDEDRSKSNIEKAISSNEDYFQIYINCTKKMNLYSKFNNSAVGKTLSGISKSQPVNLVSDPF